MLTDEKTGGERASQVRPRCYYEKGWKDEHKLVRLRYWDHVLFRNTRPEQVELTEREVVGWLVYQDPNKIMILTERSRNPQPNECVDPASGFQIVRSCIIEICEITELSSG